MYLKIEDIHSSGKEICGKLCSLLVAVRCVSVFKCLNKFFKNAINVKYKLR